MDFNLLIKVHETSTMDPCNQVRGLPHLHGVFWLKSSELKDFQNDDDSKEFSDEKVPKLIDEWISCSISTEDDDLNKLVKEVNVHKHTKSCKKGKNPCRFAFPKLPSNKTLIANPLCEEELGKEKYNEQLTKATDTLGKVKENLSLMSEEELDKTTLDEFLKELGITEEDYHWALSVSQRGKTVVLQRKLNEMWVNNYNPHFMRAWRANIDIQFCMDSYAVITYITDYLTKGDAGLTKEFRKALLEKNTVITLNSSIT